MGRTTQNVIAIDPEEAAAFNALPQEYAALRRLWSAVLYASVEDYWWGKKRDLPEPAIGIQMLPLKKVDDGCHDGTRYDRTGRYNYEQACIWLRSNEIRQGSFLWVCEHLGLDAERVRWKITQTSTYAKAKVIGDKMSMEAPKLIKMSASTRKRVEAMAGAEFTEEEMAERLGITARGAGVLASRWLGRGLVNKLGQGIFIVKEGVL